MWKKVESSETEIPYAILGWRLKQKQAGNNPVSLCLLRFDGKKWFQEDQVYGRIVIDTDKHSHELKLIFDRDDVRLPKMVQKGDEWTLGFEELECKGATRWRLCMIHPKFGFVELICDAWAFPDDWIATYFDVEYPPQFRDVDRPHIYRKIVLPDMVNLQI